MLTVKIVNFNTPFKFVQLQYYYSEKRQGGRLFEQGCLLGVIQYMKGKDGLNETDLVLIKGNGYTVFGSSSASFIFASISVGDNS